MLVNLSHPAISLCKTAAWNKLLNDCSTLRRFCSRIEWCSKKIIDTPLEQENPYYHLSGRDNAMKFKGDVFEVLAELVIRLSPLDDRIGIHNYQVITEGDTGVDGHGLTRDGEPITVQVKYRLWDKILNEIESHLDNFSLTSMNKFSVNTASRPARMLLITTGQELSWNTIDKFQGSIRCISNDASYGCMKGAPSKTVDSLFSLKTIVDNAFFWDTFRNQIGVKND